MEFTTIEQFKDNLCQSTKRIDYLINKYQELFGKLPDFLCRAPGRVNIIGEHIDYCGYGVLPMAIDQDILMLLSINKERKRIKLINSNPKYEQFEFETDICKIDSCNPKWFNYFLCGYHGIIELNSLIAKNGIDVLVDGQVPCNAGLSSSSALVCCSAMATMIANGLNFTKMELAEICQKCERYIGTEGGGMDQTICFLAEKGKAKYVQFEPLRTESVTLPKGGVFVVANSLVEMNKSTTDFFNIRVAECRLATQIIAHLLGLDWKLFCKLQQIQKHFNWSFSQCIEQIDKLLKKEPYSKQDICNILNCTEEILEKESLSERSKKCNAFKLYNRAKHVFSEAERVVLFKNLCSQSTVSDFNCSNVNQSNLSYETNEELNLKSQTSNKYLFSKNINETNIAMLGRLMNESHESCKNMYECSCVELDNLVKHSLSCGALGSRLTGAGWGGCCVSIIPEDSLNKYLEEMKKFYTQIINVSEDILESALFSTFPSTGAIISKF